MCLKYPWVGRHALSQQPTYYSYNPPQLVSLCINDPSLTIGTSNSYVCSQSALQLHLGVQLFIVRKKKLILVFSSCATLPLPNAHDQDWFGVVNLNWHEPLTIECGPCTVHMGGAGGRSILQPQLESDTTTKLRVTIFSVKRHLPKTHDCLATSCCSFKIKLASLP